MNPEGLWMGWALVLDLYGFPYMRKVRGNSDSLKQALCRNTSRQLMPTRPFCLQIPRRGRKSKCLTFTWHSTVGLEPRSQQAPSCLHGSSVNPATIMIYSALSSPQSPGSSDSPLFPWRISVVWEVADNLSNSWKLVWAAPSLLIHNLEWQSFLGASSTTHSYRLMISCRSLYFLVVNHSPLKSL